eukprot:IDg10585t1
MRGKFLETKELSIYSRRTSSRIRKTSSAFTNSRPRAIQVLSQLEDLAAVWKLPVERG